MPPACLANLQSAALSLGNPLPLGPFPGFGDWASPRESLSLPVSQTHLIRHKLMWSRARWSVCFIWAQSSRALPGPNSRNPWHAVLCSSAILLLCYPCCLVTPKWHQNKVYRISFSGFHCHFALGVHTMAVTSSTWAGSLRPTVFWLRYRLFRHSLW